MPNLHSIAIKSIRAAVQTALGGRVFWSTRDGAIAVTFDDGPHPERTPVVLDILAGRAIQATFFLHGQKVEQHKELARRIVAEGHSAQSHTQTHADLSTLSARDAAIEMRHSRETIEQLLGTPCTLIRPPWGRMRPSTPFIAAQAGLRIAMWNCDSQDYLRKPASELNDRVRGLDVGAGDIVLLHDDYQETVDALPAVLDILSAAGVPFDQLR